jgi:hypothetical protein
VVFLPQIYKTNILDSDPCASRNFMEQQWKKDYLVKCERLFERKNKVKKLPLIMMECEVTDESILTMLLLETDTAALTIATTTSLPLSLSHASSCFCKCCSFNGSVTISYILCE